MNRVEKQLCQRNGLWREEQINLVRARTNVGHFVLFVQKNLIGTYSGPYLERFSGLYYQRHNNEVSRMKIVR